MGIRDKITLEEAQNAELFIMAADVAMIEGERFKNVATYETTTSKIIKKGEEIVK